ncbi:MAG TPA: hypothetical protein VKT25_14475 [Ktedonobacteraceae bacterium]|nr:hypothetical protein [Ktedonobacteraceae bacterium]
MLQNNERSQPATLDTFTLHSTCTIIPDLLVLRYMAQKMRAHLYALSTDIATPSIMYAQERRSRTHRMVVYQPQEALFTSNLTFVGFISAVSKQVSPATIEELHRIDKILVQELASNPGLLTYSSLELRKGRWYNLVLLRDDSAHAYFRQNAMHRYAAHELATYYYAWIRLHKGILPGGLSGVTQDVTRHGRSTSSAGEDMIVRSTKYFTFAGCGQQPVIRQVMRDDYRKKTLA